ncbi:hypothetical protein B0J12DRAFT_752589 [Macrophomina phaseolina]|uniref:NADH:flavin oxidoreductase/NADH oxidase N-terminal domain-containing protein n=1 Tax=Macrophomina phaseolina TaxID=35725 RepID=A0ABQ8GBP4_9PEZI|nr:hypothetical protein B0J12DRAFT_752589 [Macrophomina phaseolina]
MSTPAQFLAQPLSFPISRRRAPNRFLKGAMSERLASWNVAPLQRGVPSRELIQLYETWGRGQIGMLVTGNIMVDPAHLEAVGNPAVPFDSALSGQRFDAFQALARAGKRHGSLMIAQISHPGRQCDARIQSSPISASDIQLKGPAMGIQHFARPRAATPAELAAIVSHFAFTAHYLERAGFDGVELHAAHGYLLAQFLSPATNTRADAYGGPGIHGRARLLTSIVRAIRAHTSPGFVLGVKLNSVEFQAGGMRTDDARELCAALEAMGCVDFVELSGGTYEAPAFAHRKESTRRREAFFIEFAEAIRPVLRTTRVYLTGGFRTAGAMAEALGTVDGVGLGRVLCHEPFLCRDLLAGKARGAAGDLVGGEDVSMSNACALMQIWRIAQGLEPWDAASAEGMKALSHTIGKYAREFRRADFTGSDDFRTRVLARL